MREIRLNVATREWVIITTGREGKPTDYGRSEAEKTHERPEHEKKCPFCPGNEVTTTEAVFSLEGGGGWAVRVVPNKYPALGEDMPLARKNAGTEHSISGFGRHEVIIDTPLHNRTIALMEYEEAEKLLDAYRQRYIAAIALEGIEHVIIFKNHGPGAGTSLKHPHSQLVALPMVSSQVLDRLASAMNYYYETGECVYCRMLADELRCGKRMVLETEHFAAFVLYAAGAPFHTWLMPRRHTSGFDAATPGEMKDLARALRDLLRKYYRGLGDPNYNLVLRSVPVRTGETSYYHWYIAIVPRMGSAAGFELGSGMFINSSIPENDAEFLRNVKL